MKQMKQIICAALLLILSACSSDTWRTVAGAIGGRAPGDPPPTRIECTTYEGPVNTRTTCVER